MASSIRDHQPLPPSPSSTTTAAAATTPSSLPPHPCHRYHSSSHYTHRVRWGSGQPPKGALGLIKAPTRVRLIFHQSGCVCFAGLTTAHKGAFGLTAAVGAFGFATQKGAFGLAVNTQRVVHNSQPYPGQGLLGPAPARYPSQATSIPSVFSTMTLQDPTWHMDTDSKWRNAMFDEYNALIKNGTWILVPRPTGVNVVRSMWLFKHKFHANEMLSRYKAQLVANGSSQQQGIDVDETFSPVVKPTTIRIVLSLAVSRKWPIYQLDVKNAFLNDDLFETVYMHQPPGFTDPRFPHHGSQVAYLLIYVDDIILTSSSPALLQQIIDSLHKEFDMTDLGALNYFLGISTDRTSTGLFLSQKKYALQLLECAHMVHCNPSRTPVDTESKLGPEGVPVQDPTLYRSLAGGLQYLTFTRPDLYYAVQQVCLYMHDPREPHFAALKRIMRYVRGTVDFGLQLYASATTSLVGYTDADWAGCPFTRSSEAEYRGVANVVAETAWLRNLLRELHSPLSTATLVYCDNVSVVYMSANPVQHQQTKQIEIDIHFVRDMVTAGQVRVLHVLSRVQYADIFTKGLPSVLFEDFRSSLSVRTPPAPTAEAY
ncbi:ribonuclease H-like domain-containing protein [Tanacetum coccineum]|uniref:Ribonuclease H-like domain-containing protein n=1 Tax=Tanacetum coccineum TaxID=301880 RepID=A0ABQ5CJW7_9ASTR